MRLRVGVLAMPRWSLAAAAEGASGPAPIGGAVFWQPKATKWPHSQFGPRPIPPPAARKIRPQGRPRGLTAVLVMLALLSTQAF